MALTTPIVIVNATVTPAPQPNTLQQQGALVSVGGSTLTTNAFGYYATAAEALAVVGAAGNHAELTHEINTFFAQGSAIGVYILEIGDQGGSVSAQITALGTWITDNPGQFYAYLCPAAWDTEGVGSVTITNGGSGYTGTPTVAFSAPGGSGTTATGTVTAVGGVITAVTITNPGDGYASPPTVTFSGAGTLAAGTAVLSSQLNSLASTYSSATGKTYFFITTSTTNMALYTNKACVTVVPSPTAASTEFQAATLFYQWLAQAPSAASPAAPMQFRYVYGVTAYPTTGNQSTLDSIITAFANYIGTGAEGGITNTLIRNGTTADGNQMMFWYDVDWQLIQADLRLSNAVINGSNRNPPLQYNQFGINELLAVLTAMGNAAITFQLALQDSYSATPFAAYVAANPTDYAAGIYKGFSATVTPQVGFTQLTFNLDALAFAG